MTALNLAKDVICLNETVLNTTCEQSVELDYLLPDYYPDIFKLLKTKITPEIQSQKIRGNKLHIDGNSVVKVLYLTENSPCIYTIEQNIPFSKTVELQNEYENTVISVIPKCYFANARAVNQRRLDVRGGISCKVKVTSPKEHSMVSKGDGSGLQFHLSPLNICDARKYSEKQFTMSESLEFGHTKPPFDSVIDYNAVVVPTGNKIIANKVICKGDLLFHILYMPSGENKLPETMDFSFPVSQIVDLSGVDESYSANVNFVVSHISFNPEINEDTKNLNCEFTVNAYCTADKNKEILVADDAFSTIFDISPDMSEIHTESHTGNVSRETVLKHTLQSDSDNSIMGVCDAFAKVNECTINCEDGTLKVCTTLEMTVICCQSDNTPFMIEKTLPIEIPLDLTDCKEINFTPVCDVVDISFNILSPNTVELRTKIRTSGPVYKKITCKTITDITVPEDAKKESAPFALHLYYAKKGESIWDIAKRFNTSLTALMEENSVEAEFLSEDLLLLIPVVL